MPELWPPSSWARQSGTARANRFCHAIAAASHGSTATVPRAQTSVQRPRWSHHAVRSHRTAAAAAAGPSSRSSRSSGARMLGLWGLDWPGLAREAGHLSQTGLPGEALRALFLSCLWVVCGLILLKEVPAKL